MRYLIQVTEKSGNQKSVSCRKRNKKANIIRIPCTHGSRDEIFDTSYRKIWKPEECELQKKK